MVCLSSFCHGQEDGSGSEVYYIKDGSIIIGHQVFEDTDKIDIVIFSGDTLTIDKSHLEKRFKRSDVYNYSKGRYHYKDGFHIDVSQGMGFGGIGAFTHFDVSLNKRLTEKVTLGLGFGSQTNFTSLRVPTGETAIMINTNSRGVPLFVQGKYYLNKNRRRLYVNARMGYALGANSQWSNISTNNGFLLNYGIGMTKATKRRVKTFVQLNQVHNYVTGTAVAWPLFGGESSIVDYSLWYNRIALTWGIEINLSKKFEKY